MEEKLMQFFKDHPHLKIQGIEKEAGIPGGMLNKVLKDERDLPEKHIQPLKRVLANYGYKKGYFEIF